MTGGDRARRNPLGILDAKGASDALAVRIRSLRKSKRMSVEVLSALDVPLLDLLLDGGNDPAGNAGCGSEASDAASRLADAVAELSGDNVTVDQVRRARKLYRLLGVELDEVEDNYR